MDDIKVIDYSPFFEYSRVDSVSVLYIFKLCVFARVDSVWSFCGVFLKCVDNVIFIFGKKIWQKK